MASMVEAFFLRWGNGKEADEACSTKRAKAEKRRMQKAEKEEKRTMANELMPKPYVDPSLQRLFNGDPIALEKQRLLNEKGSMSK